MKDEQIKEIQAIKEQYVENKSSKLDELKALDKRVKTPALVFAYTFGVIGTLALGVGMCLSMEIIGNMTAVGVAVGLVGIAMASLNYTFYSNILKARKAKYAKEIIALSDGILNE